MNYKKLRKRDADSIQILKRVEDDGSCKITCTEECPDYLAWVAEGNVAEAAPELTWDDIRETRDSILQNTDWTMTTGATVDQAQWAAYRQTIRDLPQTYKDKNPADGVRAAPPSTKGPNS